MYSASFKVYNHIWRFFHCYVKLKGIKELIAKNQQQSLEILTLQV